MKKLMIFLAAIILLNSCVTVIFEPYWEDCQKEKKIDPQKEGAVSDYDEPLG